MTQDPILVTGATGKTGRRVAALLQERGVSHRAVSRRSEIPFDWDDASTWPAAIDGVGTAYLVVPDLGTDGATAKVGRLARLLAEGGSSRVVLISTPEDGTDFSRAVRATEDAIRRAGLDLTALRLRWFNQNFSEDFLHPAVMTGALRLPTGEGREAFIDANDIAEVAVAVLTDTRHDQPSYELAGPRLMGFADIAAELTKATGRDITYVAVTPDQFVAEQLADGVPIEWASMLCGVYQVIAAGSLESLGHDVATVLGRQPRDFADFAGQAARDGAWSSPTNG